MNREAAMDATQDAGTEMVVAGGMMDAASRAELAAAMKRLRHGGGLVMRMAGAVGGMVGRTFRLGTRTLQVVPGGPAALARVVEAALSRAFDVAVLRLDSEREQGRSRRLAAPLVVLSGAVGGFLGFGGFVPDAAVTTLAIMREIARIAQEEGESLDEPEAREACLHVFALNPDETETGYFGTRLVLQGRSLALLMAEVASRFGLSLSQKFALQAVPVVGAVGGAALNAAFLSHYRELARAHFTVRRLERVFGAAAVRQAAAGQGGPLPVSPSAP